MDLTGRSQERASNHASGMAARSRPVTEGEMQEHETQSESGPGTSNFRPSIEVDHPMPVQPSQHLGMRPGERLVVEKMKELLEDLYEQNQTLRQGQQTLLSRLERVENDAMHSASSGRDRENLDESTGDHGDRLREPLPKGSGAWSPQQSVYLGRFGERGSLDYHAGIEEGYKRALEELSDRDRGSQGDRPQSPPPPPPPREPPTTPNGTRVPPGTPPGTPTPEFGSPGLEVHPPIPTLGSSGSMLKNREQPPPMARSMEWVMSGVQGSGIPQGVQGSGIPRRVQGSGISQGPSVGLDVGFGHCQGLFGGPQVGAQQSSASLQGSLFAASGADRGFGGSEGFGQGAGSGTGEFGSGLGLGPPGQALEVRLLLGIAQLPLLPDPSSDDACIAVTDWLTQIQPIMSDLSERSWMWWKRVMEVAHAAYARWQQAGPLEKAMVVCDSPVDLLDDKLTRLEARALGMIMESLPTQIKDELVVTKSLTCANAVYRILLAF